MSEHNNEDSEDVRPELPTFTPMEKNIDFE